MEKRTQQGKLTNLEIASFCSEMAMILKSGISSLEGVDLLRGCADEGRKRAVG